MKCLSIAANDAGQRLDKFLSKAVPRLPKGLLYKYIRIKRIKINGCRCYPDQQLLLGDSITLYINDEFFGKPATSPLFLQAADTVDIIYEDDNILIANKPAGLLTHSSQDERVDTLVNRIQHYLYCKGLYRPDEELSFAPALVNRLDRNTAGLVIACKNASALRTLNAWMKRREIEKYYLCAVMGSPAKESGTLYGYLVKNDAQNRVLVTDTPAPNAREIITVYRVLYKKNGMSLLEINLKTGRAHQIRAHLASIGHPVIGDPKYGSKSNFSFDGSTPYQALYAYKIRFSPAVAEGSLAYLCEKSFEVQTVPFSEYFTVD